MIAVQTDDFSVEDVHNELRQRAGDCGAMVSFVGLVREFGGNASIQAMTLEHYPGMTEKALMKIALHACEKWGLVDALIIHRVGPLLPNDRIVFVAAASAHRKNAFRACEFMIDTLKTDAPFWKQEDTPNGRRWVSADAGSS